MNHLHNQNLDRNRCDDRQEIVEFQDEDDNIDTSHNEQSAVQETNPIEAQNVENRIESIAPVPEGNLNHRKSWSQCFIHFAEER
ncbi:hypothetical protein JTB14_018329 [Gonioctena quinquepunctata]|nr:hypothetical protein JTB14_018329 [Gonioctena quinquepunctata]